MSEQKNIISALAKFQDEVGNIKKDSTNPFFKNSYASLSNILESIKLPLMNAGLVITQIPVNENELRTVIFHIETGEKIEGTFKMTPAKNDPQGQGSVITYQRRYALGAMLGLNIEDDDDANAGVKNPSTVQAPKFTPKPQNTPQTPSSIPAQQMTQGMEEQQNTGEYPPCPKCGAEQVKNPKTGKIFCTKKCWLNQPTQRVNMNWQDEKITQPQITKITCPFVLRQALKDLIPEQEKVDQYDPQITWLYNQVKGLTKGQGSTLVGLIKKGGMLQAVQLMIDYGVTLSQEKLNKLKQYENYLLLATSYNLESVARLNMKTRTSQQNRAMHLYFDHLADELNLAGMDMKKVIQVDIPWTPYNIKEFLWRPIQRSMFGKISTTKLSTKDIDKIYDTINRVISERTGVHVAFPSVEELREEICQTDY